MEAGTADRLYVPLSLERGGVKRSHFDRKYGSKRYYSSWSEKRAVSETGAHSRFDTASEPMSLGSKAAVVALRRRDSLQLANALPEALEDETFLRVLSPVAFSELLGLLDPTIFVRPLIGIHQSISESTAARLGLQPVAEEFTKFVNTIDRILSLRRKAGHQLGLKDYEFMLKCARAVGNTKIADAVWQDMLRSNIDPTTTCYNLYMAAKCWSGAYQSHQREKLRVIPYHLVMRLSKHRETSFEGYKVGKRGLKIEVADLFEDLVSRGNLGDERTFATMMIAMGREGAMTDVKGILKNVWNVDVDLLASEDKRPLPKVTEYAPNAALRPTSRLLWTIAHVFGMNNDIPIALRLIDFVSQRYDIHITNDVWAELLEWTYVLSIPRHGARRTDGAMTGKLPLSAVTTLWNTMTAEPYKIKPSMRMYNFMVRTLSKQQSPEKMLQEMREGSLIYRRHLSQWYRARHKLLAARQSKDDDKLNLTYGEVFRREEKMAYLKVVRDRTLLRSWIRLWLGNPDWPDSGHWNIERRAMPNFIAEWQDFLPTVVSYPTSQGRVSLLVRPETFKMRGAYARSLKFSGIDETTDEVSSGHP